MSLNTLHPTTIKISKPNIAKISTMISTAYIHPSPASAPAPVHSHVSPVITGQPPSQQLQQQHALGVFTAPLGE